MRSERWLYTIPLRLRSLFRRRELDRELDEELRDHISRKTYEYVAKGMQPQEARRAALLEIRGVERCKEECRETRRIDWIQDLIQDLRYGLRVLAKSPGFSTIAIAILALGIGANVAIFSIVQAVLLKPLPFPDPGQLVFLSEAKPQNGITSAGASYDNFNEIRAQKGVFSELAGFTTHQLTLTGRGEPAPADTGDVTPEFFTLLGTKPVIGRVFVPDDNKPGAPTAVILSESVWRDRFVADPNVIGSSVSLDHRPYTVVGVMPDEPSVIFSPRRIQFWIPIAQDPLFGPWIPRQDLRWLAVIGRLHAGVSFAQAQSGMEVVAAQLAKKFPTENSGWVIRLQPLQRVIVGDVRTALLVLLGAVGLVLLIACANISNLLLARATSRGKEIALRIALGAGRARLVRQLLTESAVLGLTGGAAGILLAYWGVHALTSFLPEDIPQIHAIRVDASVLLFALALALFASFLFGLAPAFFALKSDVQATLKEGAAHSSETVASRFARGFLGAAEVALAMVLLVAAGVLLRSFAALASVNPGFSVTHLVKADIQLPQFQYSKPEQWVEFSDELLRRLQSEPGMHDCAIGLPLPLNAQGSAVLPFEIMDHAALPKGTPESADFVSVSPGYFHVMGIALRRGRAFNGQDVSSAPRVTIISETFARRYFANEDPIGKQLVFSFPPNPAVPRQIVGIVGDVRDVSIGQDPGPMMYAPFDQSPFWGAELVVRSELNVGSVAATIRHDVHQVDKDLPVTGVVSMSDLVATSVAQPRFRMWLLGSFALIALVLAAAGIFGVISYSVSRRTHELGIRITLGASPASVMRLIFSESARLVLIGLAVGIPVALGLGRFLSNLLFGVRAADPATFTAVALLLFAVATLAAYVPARRATRVDPMIALRHE
ncbi:MAG: ABC transporter permease [Candidatus Acidiferrales bacterium]